MKAILELDELPESCMDCPILASYQEFPGAMEEWWCPPMNRTEDLTDYKNQRSPHCPLKIID